MSVNLFHLENSSGGLYRSIKHKDQESTSTIDSEHQSQSSSHGHQRRRCQSQEDQVKRGSNNLYMNMAMALGREIFLAAMGLGPYEKKM